jgi:hypothetical protein
VVTDTALRRIKNRPTVDSGHVGQSNCWPAAIGGHPNQAATWDEGKNVVETLELDIVRVGVSKGAWQNQECASTICTHACTTIKGFLLIHVSHDAAVHVYYVFYTYLRYLRSFV